MEADAQYDNSEEEEEEEEEVECLRPASLVGVILEGAADLLTLEESYVTLTLRVRETLYDIGPPTERAHNAFMAVVQPIADEAPALVRAMARDLHRLMGKVPQAEATTTASTPFRHLRPETRKTGLLSPGSTPTKGFTAAEILYRREAASVGSAVLRFLAAVFSSPRLFTCFTEADLQSLLDQVLVIPKTPILPTPQPRRTYALSMVIFSNIRLHESLLALVKDKIIGAVDSALNTIGTGAYNIRDPAPLRREAYLAADHLVSHYPRLFFSAYPQFLASAVRGMGGPAALRRSATAAATTFVNAKRRLVQEADEQVETGEIDAVEWSKTRALVRKSEQFVVNFLKSPAKVQAKDYDGRGVKVSEWAKIESVFRSTVGSAEEVGWACTTWAVLVSLMGQAYNTSTQLKGINHIMDRSLQQSANAVRPVLACAAWQHAIHAYLLSGSNATVSDAGKVVQTHVPFAASSHHDVASRISNILFPLTLALDKAHDSESVTRSLVSDPSFKGEKRWAWQRSEKIRRFGWMITTGGIAPAVIYAYTVLAMEHVESTGKEVSKISGLPSSDGPAIDISPEEDRIPRLDKVFDLVVHPILKRSFSVCGVDKLKVQAWEMLEAITAPSSFSETVATFDRLLSKRFLERELLSVEAAGPDTAETFEKDRITASEIPAWGKLWVAKRLGKVLALFREALDGVYGLDSLTATKWVANSDGLVLLPAALSRVWTNLLTALAITNSESGPTPLFVVGLQAVAKLIVHAFDTEPSKYIPIRLLDSEGKTTLNADAVRIGITLHLYQEAVKVLGEKTLGSTLLNIDIPSQPDNADFKHEPFGYATTVGYLLGHILRTEHLTTNDAQVRERFCQLVGSLLSVGSTLGTRTLGEVTNMMPWIFERQEHLQLDVWRLLALRWTDVVDLQPTDTASSTNHTGALLVSLLSTPFRNGTDSVWFSNPADADFHAWRELLKATVLRFRAKRVGSNFGVLETLSAHLDDFLRVDSEEETKKRKGCASTLRCLAAGTSWISFAPTEHYHASHYNINENYVPVDFLTLVSESLLAADDPDVTLDLVKSVADLFTNLTADVVDGVIDPLHAAIAKVMNNKDTSDDLGTALDGLYIATLGALSRAIQSGSIPSSTETVNAYINLYAPRLSSAKSENVLIAFQEFWAKCFQRPGLRYSDDTAGFLQDVTSALPGFIEVVGLDSESQGSGADYPFAESIRSQVGAVAVTKADLTAEEEVEIAWGPVANSTRSAQAPEAAAICVPETAAPNPAEQPTTSEPSAVQQPSSDPTPVFNNTTSEISPVVNTSADATETSPVINTSAEYDADASQASQPRGKKRKQTELVPVSSPMPPADVFGPATKTNIRVGRRRLSSPSGSREVSIVSDSHSSPNLANDTVIADTDIESPVNFTPSDDARGGLFTHASRWLRKVPSFGLFSPAQEGQTLAMQEEEVSPSITRPDSSSFREQKRSSAASGASSESGSAKSSPGQSKSSRRRKSKRLELDARQERAKSASVQVDEPVAPAPVEPVKAAVPVATKSKKVAAKLQPRRSLRHAPQEEAAEVVEPEAVQPPPIEPVAIEVQAPSEPEQPAPQPTRSSRRKRKSPEPAPETTKKRKTRLEARKEPEAEDELLLSDASALLNRQEEDESIREQEAALQAEQEATATPAGPEIEAAHEMATTVAPQNAEAEATALLGRLTAEQNATGQVEPSQAIAEQANPSKRKKTKAAAKTTEPRRSTRGRPLEEQSQQSEQSAQISESAPSLPSQASESGVFDDAPGDETPVSPKRAHTEGIDIHIEVDNAPAEPPRAATPPNLDDDPLDLLPSPARRTATQTRVLDMINEAARHEEAIEHLDIRGIKELLANLDRLKNAATSTLLSRVEEAREHARSRSRSQSRASHL